jgi:release factor glutamine methyltransferase
MSGSAEPIWTIAKLLEWTSRYFAEKGAESPRLDAEVLLASVLDCPRIQLYVRFEESASEESRGKFRELVKKRVEGCPVAYLVGRKEFFSLEFEVTPAVLIPRPDTETLVAECIKSAQEHAEPKIVDVGTGSGCIAIALAKQLPEAKLTAIDISALALEVAKRNAAKHHVENRIEFVEGDLLTKVPADAQFDFIVSNPPYIGTEEIAGLPTGVREHEPKLALDGGVGGYEVVARLIQQAKDKLTRGGQLFVEIGSSQEQHVIPLLQEAGFASVNTLRDHGGLPRVIRALKS